MSHPADRVARMNPNRHRAADLRRRAIEDQIQGLERLIDAGEAGEHHRRRLADTRVELASLEGSQ